MQEIIESEEQSTYKGKEKAKGIKAWFTPKMIAYNSIVAALYVVLTIACFYASYGLINFRVSEILNILVFFNPAYTVGLTAGCLISNAFGLLIPMNGGTAAGPWDLLIGTGATLLGCLAMIPWKHLFPATLMPVISNAFIVGIELTFLMDVVDHSIWWVAVGYVFLGEFIIISIIGYGIFLFLSRKNKPVLLSLNATKNVDFKW